MRRPAGPRPAARAASAWDDDCKGEVIGLWRQLAPVKGDDGRPIEIAGTGGSWFRYGGDWKWIWQRDFFDHGNAGAVFLDLLQKGRVSPRCRNA